MATNQANGNDPPSKVFLWATPRSVSTAFLKCMTYVPDIVAWHEPYHHLIRVGQDKDDILAVPFADLVEKMGGQAAVDKIEGGFDARNASFNWLKETLEGDFPGKKAVFVKSLSLFINGFDRFDKIPTGFRHTFLIRNPYKGAMSILKIKKQKSDTVSTTDILKDKMRPNKMSYDLYQYVKEHFDSKPVVIDADDLLANPKAVLEAYCKAVNIPYSDDLLSWPAGDEVMTKLWMVPKEVILTYWTNGSHASVFASTGFKKSSGEPAPTKDQLPPALAKLVDEEMPYYEKLYAERLIC